MREEDARVWEFLSSMPPPATKDWEAWRKECLLIGDRAPEIFVVALELGDDAQQYAALLALRIFGWEVYLESTQSGEGYRVRSGKDASVRWIAPRPSSHNDGSSSQHH